MVCYRQDPSYTIPFRTQQGHPANLHIPTFILYPSPVFLSRNNGIVHRGQAFSWETDGSLSEDDHMAKGRAGYRGRPLVVGRLRRGKIISFFLKIPLAFSLGLGYNTLRTFLSSSMAEHSAVNRRVVGSSPTWGANQKAVYPDGFFDSLCIGPTLQPEG